MSSFPAIQACPNCSRVAPFTHTETTITICVCGEVLNRREVDGLVVKAFQEIEDSGDLIQPGTTGIWQQKSFTVLGRFRVWVKEAVVNYWTISFEDGGLKYLVESYGMYAIYAKMPPDGRSLNIDINRLHIGHIRELQKGNSYLLEKKDECYRWEVAGEVWMPESDTQFTILDFSSATGDHVQIAFFQKNKPVAYQIFYTSFTELQLDKLQITRQPNKQISCEKCTQPIDIIAYPYSQSLACKNCKTRYVLKRNGEYQSQIIRNEIDAKPDLQLGATGKLKGIEFVVIGATIKQEQAGEGSRWREYTLYNRQEGYAFLSEYDGHWIYTRQRGDTPVLPKETDPEFTYENEPFQLFNHYRFEVRFASGEFSNNLFNDSEKFVREFISPPEMWIRERSANEGIEWYFGQHTSSSELEEAFDEKIELPYKKGTGAIQPTGYVNLQKMVWVSLVSVAALILLHFVTMLTHRQQLLFNKRIAFADTAQNLSAVTQSIKLDKAKSNIEVVMTALVDNSWAEIDLALVNSKTGEEFGVSEGIEYYRGYEDGESWSEGSQQATAYFTNVPAGEYTLQISAVRDITGMTYTWAKDINLQITYDVTNHRNLFICIGMVLLFAVIQYFMAVNNEKRRWMNSPLSPYNHEN